MYIYIYICISIYVYISLVACLLLDNICIYLNMCNLLLCIRTYIKLLNHNYINVHITTISSSKLCIYYHHIINCYYTSYLTIYYIILIV